MQRGKMIAYEFKGGYYGIKKAGDLKKRDRDKWGIKMEKDYGELLAKKKLLDEKRAWNGGTVGSEESKVVEGPTVKCWKPGSRLWTTMVMK